MREANGSAESKSAADRDLFYVDANKDQRDNGSRFWWSTRNSGSDL